MSSPTLPTSAPDETSDFAPDLDLEEMDIHGKLVMLNAIDLSCLNLASRCAMILLSGPWCSDDLGRFMGSPGFLPDLSPLSKKQVSLAVSALEKKGLIKTWSYAGSHCWEVAGAFAFKKGLKAAFTERRKLAQVKRRTQEQRRNRRQEEFQGDSYRYEDDGSPNADGVVECIRTAGGGHVPMRPTMFHRSKVPTPKGVGKYKLIVPQPKNETGCELHLYPSFNVYDGLSPLGVVIRHLLLWQADDYGKVRIDIPALHSELGAAITKRVAMKDIELEIRRMSGSGHLLVSRRASGTYAYIRDAAQHLKKHMLKDMKLPRLHEDREFTHDSEAYKAFIEECRAHSTKRDKVYLGSYTKEGIVYVVYGPVRKAAKHFVDGYHKIMSSERYAAATPETIYGISSAANMDLLRSEELFYYGYLHKMPCEWMETIYREGEEEMAASDQNSFKILRYLMEMTPLKYLQKLRTEAPGESATA